MAVFRIERTRDYTVMSNHHLRNANLSLKAKGLLSMMLSLPEDWNYTTRGLAKICKEGVDAIGAALRELEAAGYIVRHKLRDRQGRISDTEYGELEQYRASNNVNRQCKESIEAAVREHFDGMYLSHDAAKGVIETYGMERVSMVLSNTIQLQDWDGRYSRRNKEWAKTIPNDNPETVRCGYALNSHPAVLDGFIDLVREEQQRSRTQREKLEPSVPQYGISSNRSCPPISLPPQKTGAGAITMAKRKRDVPVLFWVSAEELELIHQKMQQYGTENLSAYLRKMALDGYVVKLELPELKELVSLMRRSSNNLNQLTRKVHETGRVYNADLEDISQRQEQLWEGVKEILTQLSKLS